MYKFTVVWGNIGDGHERRVDHVEVAGEELGLIMEAAIDTVQEERENDAYYADEIDAKQGYEALKKESYDGYAIFEGHIIPHRTIYFS